MGASPGYAARVEDRAQASDYSGRLQAEGATHGHRAANQTSAVREAEVSLINDLQNKSALHRRPFHQFRTDPQPLREFHAQEMQKGRLGRLGTYLAP